MSGKLKNLLLSMRPTLKRMGVEKQWREDGKCHSCGGEMKEGIAIGQTYRGVPDFPDGEVCTFSPGGPGKLVPVMKCVKCGWSYT